MQAGTPPASISHPVVCLHQALLGQQLCQVLLLVQHRTALSLVYLSPSDAQGSWVGRQQVQNQVAWALTAGTASCAHLTDLT